MEWIVSVAIALLLWGASFLYLHSYTRRRTDPAVILASYADEAERLVATIDAATDRDARLVEDRIKTLRALLEETDRRLATLSREFERRTREELSRAQLVNGTAILDDVSARPAGMVPPAPASATTAASKWPAKCRGLRGL